MKPKLISALLAFSLAGSLANAAPAHDEAAARQRYETCLGQAQSNPGGALGNAGNWLKNGGGVPASHCEALALVGLHRYAE
ncbi:MAG TPA: hypothetical protein VIJ72_03710, partial [Rhizomicrobium sp.]